MRQLNGTAWDVKRISHIRRAAWTVGAVAVVLLAAFTANCAQRERTASAQAIVDGELNAKAKAASDSKPAKVCVPSAVKDAQEVIHCDSQLDVELSQSPTENPCVCKTVLDNPFLIRRLAAAVNDAKYDKVFMMSYDVKDLVYPRQQLDSSGASEHEPHKTVTPDFESLTKLVEQLVEPADWQRNGGIGSIGIDKATKNLVVAHTRAAHEQVAALLKELRALNE